MLSARCALVSASYAVLLSHFIYRYLALHNSELTNDKFHTYMTISFGIFCVYFVVWHAVSLWNLKNCLLNFISFQSCFYLGGANLEIKEYIRTDFRDFYRMDSMDMNMISCLYREGTDHTLLRSWSTTILWTSISAISICMFLMLACMVGLVRV